jgi:hypothetical protein
MDIKTAIDVLKGLKYKLRNSEFEEDQIVAAALETILNPDIQETGAEVLYLCDRKKCRTCSYPKCKYTTDISHAGSFVVNECGMYKEIETKSKRKTIKEMMKRGVRKR